MLGPRLLVAALAIPVVIGIAWVGSWLLLALALVAVYIGLMELERLFFHAGIFGPWPVAYTFTPLFVLDAAFPDLSLGKASGVLLVIASLAWAVYRKAEPKESVVGWTVTVASSLYLGLPIALGVALRLRDDPPGLVPLFGFIPLPSGLVWMIFAFGLTWACDSAAYFTGKRFGKRPFFHHISPNKTLEGAIGGLVAAALVGLIVSPTLQFSLLSGLLIGLAGGVAAIIGDLGESLVKRACIVKDSGWIFPGHGGLLDRIDSLLFVIVVIYYGGEMVRSLQSLAPTIF